MNDANRGLKQQRIAAVEHQSMQSVRRNNRISLLLIVELFKQSSTTAFYCIWSVTNASRAQKQQQNAPANPWATQTPFGDNCVWLLLLVELCKQSSATTAGLCCWQRNLKLELKTCLRTQPHFQNTLRDFIFEKSEKYNVGSFIKKAQKIPEHGGISKA